MIPKEFDYVAPSSVAEALQALKDGGEDAKILAGGHSLIPLMKLRLAAPTRLVDLRNIADLRGSTFTRNNSQLIGAMTTYAELAQENNLLAECAASVGDTQVRARGTIGGSLAHADPAADLPAAILALDGVLRAAHLNGDGSTVATRDITAADFFVDLLTTALQPGEILTTVFIPDRRFGTDASARTGTAYVKVRNKASHYALVGAAVVLGLGDDGVCNHAAIAITGAAAKPFRLTSVENALKGTRAEESDLANALGTLHDLDVNWMADLHGSADYRRHLTDVVAARALQMARSRINS